MKLADNAVEWPAALLSADGKAAQKHLVGKFAVIREEEMKSASINKFYSPIRVTKPQELPL